MLASQNAGVPEVVVTPEEQCPCDNSVPRMVVTPGRCCAGQDILCRARVIGAADSAMAPWVSCLERTRGAMGVTGLGGFLPRALLRSQRVLSGRRQDRQGSGTSHVAVPMYCLSPACCGQGWPLGLRAIGVPPVQEASDCEGVSGPTGEGSGIESTEVLPSQLPAP